MRNVLTAFGIVFVIATIMPFIRHDYWWIRIFDFPRLQIATLGLAIFVLMIVFVDRTSTFQIIVIILLGLSLTYQAYRIWKYTPLAHRQVLASSREVNESTLSLMVANVLMTNRDSGRFLKIISETQPDLLCTVETDDWWENQLRQIEDDYPYQVKVPLDNTYGMLLYSRLRLEDTEVTYLVEEGIPSIRTRVLLRSGISVLLYCLHPRPPYPTEALQSTERDAELLIVGKEVKSLDTPTVVMGDLNDVAWSHTTRLFQQISGLLDPRIGRGMFNSFHAEYPLIRYPLDHLFHSDHFKLISLKRLPKFGSDHFPIFGHLNYEAEAKSEQLEPQATPEEEKEAVEKIVKAKEDSISEAP